MLKWHNELILNFKANVQSYSQVIEYYHMKMHVSSLSLAFIYGGRPGFQRAAAEMRSLQGCIHIQWNQRATMCSWAPEKTAATMIWKDWLITAPINIINEKYWWAVNKIKCWWIKVTWFIIDLNRGLLWCLFLYNIPKNTFRRENKITLLQVPVDSSETWSTAVKVKVFSYFKILKWNLDHCSSHSYKATNKTFQLSTNALFSTVI